MDCIAPDVVQIRTIEGNALDLGVDLKRMTVQEMKHVLAVYLMIPFYVIRLYFNGRQLLNDTFLRDYHITQNNTIFIDTRKK